ncbi:hypothetical protein [Kitasatospora sp. NBC_01302]|uniref:hypothetical protein n=1 Tax=Kitasatospora sp. NBC_01302 TaxID=2903575 RepID=UPI002E1387A5|nr:hypothetical protein OG294_04925 [Kitasatospora sp. NBC_01302]
MTSRQVSRPTGWRAIEVFDGDRGYAAYLASLSYYALCLALTWWAGLRGQAGEQEG